MSEQNNNIEPRTDWAWCYENPRLEATAIDELQDQLNELASQYAAPIPEQVAQASGIEGLTRYEPHVVEIDGKLAAKSSECKFGDWLLFADVERLLATQSAKQSTLQEENRQLRERIEDLTTAANQCINDAIGQSAQEVTQQAAKAETADQANVLPPTRGTDSQHNADPYDVIEFALELAENKGNQDAMDFLAAWWWETNDDFLRVHWPDFAKLELSSRCRAQGGNTNTESSDLAPTTSTVSASGSADTGSAA